MPKKKPHSGSKTVALFVVAVAAIIIFKSVKYYLTHSAYFKINSVKIVGAEHQYDDKEARRLCGISVFDNIFKVRPREIRGHLEKTHPEFGQVIVRKRLPDSLEVALTRRDVLGQVAFGRYYPVDKEGYVMNGVTNLPQENVPIISGLNFKASQLKVGEVTSSGGLKDALRFLDEIYRCKEELGKIIKLEHKSGKAYSLYLEGNIEIKILDENVAFKISRLAVVLSDIKAKGTPVGYIDVRFSDPIVGVK